MYIPLIFIGNVGIAESYIYIFCAIVGIAIVYFCLKPFTALVVKKKMYNLFGYLISSIPVLIVCIFIASIVDNPNKIMLIAFQSLAIFGILFSLFIWIERYLRKTNS